MKTIRRAFAYLWDLKAKKIEKMELEARHPYAKVFDKVFGSPLVGARRLVAIRRKDS